MIGYYGNKLCIPARELVEGGYMTKAAYEKNVTRRKITVVRRGGGAKGQCALVAVDSLPAPCREKVEEKFGCDEARIRGWVMSNYELDQAALAFFMDWAAGHKSDHATAELAHKYAVNASVLNTCISLYERAKTAQGCSARNTTGLRWRRPSRRYARSWGTTCRPARCASAGR